MATLITGLTQVASWSNRNKGKKCRLEQDKFVLEPLATAETRRLKNPVSGACGFSIADRKRDRFERICNRSTNETDQLFNGK